jgi:hypothetical protein|tara:strand:+ start:66 stop:275 length:210 start_codon:yes stop_codon:yes gene_type:complete
MAKITRRFTIDSRGNRAYVGSKVHYNNSVWLLEDIQRLAWNKNQYLTLQDVRNKNKKIEFINPQDIKVV